MTRRRDHLIDKKIGSVIRMQRVKLGMSQMELGEALGVTFQQIQKYEHGRNAVASTRRRSVPASTIIDAYPWSLMPAAAFHMLPVIAT